MALQEQPPEQLSLETDDNRLANHVTSVIDSNGRRIVFYEKEFNSGRLTGGQVTNAGGLFIDVTAGTGNLNSIPASWSASLGLAVQSQKFQLVGYNLNTSSLVVIDDLQMSALKNIIQLAYIFAGTTSIVRVLCIEKTGRYIYVRRQIDQGGSVFAYEGIEDIMNSGTDPQAFFDSVAGRIYITYKKNGMVFQRIVEVGNEVSAWNYIIDFNDVGNVLVYLEKFQNETPFNMSANSPLTKIANSYMSLVVQGNTDPSGVDHTYQIQLPSIGGELLVPEFYEIYILVAGVQVLQESVPFSQRLELKDISTPYSGLIFLGFRGTFRGNPFVQDEFNRVKIRIHKGDQITQPTVTKDAVNYRALTAANSSSSEASSEITSTLPQLITILHSEQDGPVSADSSSSEASSEITSTLPQLNTILHSEQDGPAQAEFSASEAFSAIVP